MRNAAYSLHAIDVPLSKGKSARSTGQDILLELGRLLTWRAELYDLSAVQRSGILQRLPKVLRYIKLNYLCHDHLLLYEPLWRGWDAQRSDSNGPTKPIRIGNARTRAIGACAGVLCKWRMISST